MTVLLLCGGVGGARMARGFAAALSPDQLRIAVNVGDDFIHCGLTIAPDLDTVMYTLADAHDAQRGWGLRNETWNIATRVAELGGPSWFRLGDFDLATHLTRSARLAEGQSLSTVTEELCLAFGVRHRIAPVSDQTIRTEIHTDDAVLEFQEYFVRLQARPVARQIFYAGAQGARLAPAVREALSDQRLSAVFFAPSNPWLSIAPMLAIAELATALAHARVPVVAVSPIVAGHAIKGPAAKLSAELGHEVSAFGVARYYANRYGCISHFVIDHRDAALAPRIRALGMEVFCSDIMIPEPLAQERLARELIALAGPK